MAVVYGRHSLRVRRMVAPAELCFDGRWARDANAVSNNCHQAVCIVLVNGRWYLCCVERWLSLMCSHKRWWWSFTPSHKHRCSFTQTRWRLVCSCQKWDRSFLFVNCFFLSCCDFFTRCRRCCRVVRCLNTQCFYCLNALNLKICRQLAECRFVVVSGNVIMEYSVRRKWSKLCLANEHTSMNHVNIVIQSSTKLSPTNMNPYEDVT